MLRKSVLVAIAIAFCPVAAYAVNDSKNISDGAAKGQASELTATAPSKGCPTTPSGSPAKDNGSLSTYRTSPTPCDKTSVKPTKAGSKPANLIGNHKDTSE
jgi:hypothetical protein